jgi:hypothetical protein
MSRLALMSCHRLHIAAHCHCVAFVVFVYSPQCLQFHTLLLLLLFCIRLHYVNHSSLIYYRADSQQ